jgi:hypothetical protein
MIQSVLPLHECAAKPLQDVVEFIADPAAADPTDVESAAESLHSATNPTVSGAALTETFCLCVQD